VRVGTVGPRESAPRGQRCERADRERQAQDVTDGTGEGDRRNERPERDAKRIEQRERVLPSAPSAGDGRLRLFGRVFGFGLLPLPPDANGWAERCRFVL
jgi:hypothetical protein